MSRKRLLDTSTLDLFAHDCATAAPLTATGTLHLLRQWAEVA